MFTVNHFIWLAVCAASISAALFYLLKKKPPLKDVLTVCCVLAVLSELIKTFSMMQMIPSADGSRLFMYLEMQHLPLHLCSIHIFTMFYCRLAKDSPAKDTILAFIYPTGVVGALLALAMPSILNGTISPDDAFKHPLGYQFFLYHSMLIVLGAYILLSGQVKIRNKHYFTTLGILGTLAFASLYFNSMFASVEYKNSNILSVEYIPNLFFTYRTPIGIKLTELWHWYLYIAIIAVLAVVLMTVMFIPVFVRNRKVK